MGKAETGARDAQGWLGTGGQPQPGSFLPPCRTLPPSSTARAPSNSVAHACCRPSHRRRLSRKAGTTSALTVPTVLGDTAWLPTTAPHLPAILHTDKHGPHSQLVVNKQFQPLLPTQPGSLGSSFPPRILLHHSRALKPEDVYYQSLYDLSRNYLMESTLPGSKKLVTQCLPSHTAFRMQNSAPATSPCRQKFSTSAQETPDVESHGCNRKRK